MPVSVSCTCGVNLKAPDHLAGKSVKCPKCAVVLRVPNLNGRAPAPTGPALRKPAAAGPRTKPPPQPHGGKTNGFDIPVTMRQEVDAEIVRGENLIWFGQPSAVMSVLRRYVYPLIGGVFMMLSFAPLIFFLFDPKWSTAMLLLISAAFFLFGLVMMVTPVFFFIGAKNTWYALTNKRAIVHKRGKNTSYTPEELQNVRFQRIGLFGNDAGDVIMKTDVKTVTTSYSSRNTGEHLGTGTKTVRTHSGFLSLSNAREVERMIHEKLLHHSAPPPLQPDAPPPSAPIPVTCSCGSRIKAPPQMAGKTAKCPKCKQPITVPYVSAPPIVSQLSQPATSELGTSPAAGKVSPYWQEKLQAELGYGEQVVWSSRPLIRVRLMTGLALAVLGMLGSVLVAGFGVLQQFAPVVDLSFVTVYAFAAAMFVFSFLSIFVTIWRAWRRSFQFCYVLTNRRAMVWKTGLFGLSQDNYGPAELGSMHMRKSWIVKGAGDVVFREETKVVENRMQPAGRSVPDSSRFHSKTIRHGFLSIDNVEDVFNLVRRTLVGS